MNTKLKQKHVLSKMFHFSVAFLLHYRKNCTHAYFGMKCSEQFRISGTAVKMLFSLQSKRLVNFSLRWSFKIKRLLYGKIYIFLVVA